MTTSTCREPPHPLQFPTEQTARTRGRSPTAVLFRYEMRKVFMGPVGRRVTAQVSAALAVVWGALGAAEELGALNGAHATCAMLDAAMLLGTAAAISISADALAGERERGGLMPLLLTPMSRPGTALGKLGAPIAIWLVTMLLSLLPLWALSATETNFGRSIAALALLGTPVAVGFSAITLALAALIERKRSVSMLSMAVLASAAGPLLLGSKLRHSLAGRILDVIDPVYAAAHAFRAIVIEYQPILTQGCFSATGAAFLALMLVCALHCSRRWNG